MKQLTDEVFDKHANLSVGIFGVHAEEEVKCAPAFGPAHQPGEPLADAIEVLCARIKAADDAAASSDYMLDSDDCIAVLRGTWKSPMQNDYPLALATSQQPVEPAKTQQRLDAVGEIAREAFEHALSGVEYQQGSLFGYEVREYLLEKFNRTCMYCNAQNVPLQIEHITSKAKGGSNRISNLGLSCGGCNQKKGAMDVREFVKDPVKLKRILARAQAPLKDAAAVNATRWVLFNTLKLNGLPVQTGTGGQTKFNRIRFGIPKGHALDAACVGNVGDVRRPATPVLQVKCTGRGSHCRTRLDAFGFPRGYLIREKSVKGFRTGDMVKATVTRGTKIGVYTGRIAVRRTGSFNIQTGASVIQGISYKHCRITQRGDGYGYSSKKSSIQAEQHQERTREAGHANA